MGMSMSNIHGVFNIRLAENLRLFVMVPSRCGKTILLSKLLEKNIHAFARLPPSKAIYIVKVLEPKHDVLELFSVNFMEDNDNIAINIKSSVSGQSIYGSHKRTI